MKKAKKVLVSALMAVLALPVACAFAACDNSGEKTYNGTYTGEYHYNGWGTEYGVKVEVTVENNVIKSVKPVASDYVEASPDSGTKWTQATWTDNAASVYAKYEGKTVAEIKAIKVPTEEGGAPTTGETYSGLVHSGATLSSGRFLLAVQNALK